MKCSDGRIGVTTFFQIKSPEIMQYIQQEIDLLPGIVRMDAETVTLSAGADRWTAHGTPVNVIRKKVSLQPVHHFVATQHEAVDGALAFNAVPDALGL